MNNPNHQNKLMFTISDYHILSDIVFQDNYPGYRPYVVEGPGGGGDGTWDTGKHYASVAEKYIERFAVEMPEQAQLLDSYLTIMHEKAEEIATELEIPQAFWPMKKYATMRISYHTPGAITNPHVDYCLFTIVGYRSHPETFQFTEEYTNIEQWEEKVNQSFHFSQLLELIKPEYKGMSHRVVADPQEQYHVVYFASPDRKAVLPNGITVEEGSRSMCSARYKYVDDDDANQDTYIPW